MTKDKGEKKLSSEESGDLKALESSENLEAVLASFVKTFESSAKRWEQTIYPFITSFEASAKRWERMVYPAIIVFGLMGLSGFWLIYSLTTDVHELARNVDPKMERNLALMAENISKLCVFQSKPATDSTASLPPIPHEGCHLFQVKPATP